MGVDTISIKVLLGNGTRQSRIHELIFKYLNKTGIVNRIKKKFPKPRTLHTPDQ